MKPRKRKPSSTLPKAPFYLYVTERAQYDALPPALLEEMRAAFGWPAEHAAALARRLSAGCVPAGAAQALSRDSGVGAGLVLPFLLDPAPHIDLPGAWYRGRLMLGRNYDVRVYVNFGTAGLVTIGSEGKALPPENLYIVTPGLLH